MIEKLNSEQEAEIYKALSVLKNFPYDLNNVLFQYKNEYYKIQYLGISSTMSAAYFETKVYPSIKNGFIFKINLPRSSRTKWICIYKPEQA